MSARYEHFEHDADIGVRGLADTLPGAFEQAALALTAVITDPRQVAARQAVSVRCRAPDPELLLYDFLNALVYEMATKKLLFGRFDVRIDGDGLDATAQGEPLDVARHAPAVEIKGATLTELRVARLGNEWLAQCVVDV